MMAGLSPTQRTLKELKKQGVYCDIVERWIKNPKHPAGGFRRDYRGIIDIIGLDLRTGKIRGVQSCGNSFSAHYKKLTIEERENSVLWLSFPTTTLEIWAWRKVKKKRGGKLKIWMPRIRCITEFDLRGHDE